MNEDRISLRVARQSDASAVTAVLASAYAELMAADYEPAALAAALPAMTVANAELLGSGTYYVQEAAGGRVVSCGGWTHHGPGTRMIEEGVAHIRHFGTHVGWIRKGLATGIFERCKQDARAAGVRAFRCFSSLGAEPFYASLGFYVVERTVLTIGGSTKFPTVTMAWTEQPTAREGPDALTGGG